MSLKFRNKNEHSDVILSLYIKQNEEIFVEIIQTWNKDKSGIGFTLKKDQIKTLKDFLNNLEEY
jgi:hypothetical protein